MEGEGEDRALCFSSEKLQKPIIKIKQDGQVEIAKNGLPNEILQVNGMIKAEGLIGNYRQGEIKANGKWHTVIDNLKGCNIFEVAAIAYGERYTGKYATMHAIASNAYSGKWGNIRYNHNYYGWNWWKRIQLRWKGNPNNYKLQIRSQSNYGIEGKIDYNISLLKDKVLPN